MCIGTHNRMLPTIILMEIPIEIQEKFVDYLNGDFRAPEFENWIYTDKDLETLLGEENYLEIASFNFKQKGANIAIKSILEKYIDYSKYETQFILNLIKGIKEKSKSCQGNLKTTYHLYCSGYDFLDNLGIGYGLKLVVPYEFGADSWEEIEEEKRAKIISDFYPQLAEEADKVIDWIVNGKVKLTGVEGERGRLEYIDKRSVDEKKATSYSRDEK